MIYWILIWPAWLVLHIIFHIKVIGRENLIKGRGFVICCNHISIMDPFFVAMARLFGRKLLILAKEELFKNPICNWFFRSLGAVPVARGKGDSSVLERATEQVKNGRGMLIFPEGTRTKDGKLGKLKSGAFVVASAAQVDMIPCRIIYKGGKLRLFHRVTIVFGQPLPAQELAIGEEHPAAQLREIKRTVTEKLEALLETNKKYL